MKQVILNTKEQIGEFLTSGSWQSMNGGDEIKQITIDYEPFDWIGQTKYQLAYYSRKLTLLESGYKVEELEGKTLSCLEGLPEKTKP